MFQLFFTTLFVLVVVYARPEMYADDFDHIDIDEILASKRLVDNYLHCIKTGQKCTPDGLKLKEVIPDALSTKCVKCTDTQKQKAEKVIEWIIENRPDDFLDVETQYDPEHKYRVEFEDELKKRNIILPPLN